LQRQDFKITESLNMMLPARDSEGFSLVDLKQYFFIQSADFFSQTHKIYC